MFYISGLGIANLYSLAKEVDMESTRNRNENNVQKEELLVEEQEEKRLEILKRRICSHPLYGMLVEAHLDCLKVGEISNMNREQIIAQKQAMISKYNLGMFSQSELDLFMEAYCVALGKLKEAMEEPQEKSMAFINNMHSQLRDLTLSAPPGPAPATSSSHCNIKSDTGI